MSSASEKDKREKIIIASVKVFSQKGFHEAKVEEIAQLADVGKGTVYEYFSSKTELFQEMFKAGMQFYTDIIEKELTPEMSSREKLSRIAKIHLSFIMKYKDLAKITMTEHPYFNEDFHRWVWENRERKLETLKQIIDDGVQSGEFRPVDSYAAALTVMGTMGASCSPVIFGKGKASHKKNVEPVLDIIFNGLLNSK